MNQVIDNKKMKTYAIYEGWSNDCDGNRYHITEFKAKDIDHAIARVKKEYINKDVLNDIQEEGDNQSIFLTYDYFTDHDGKVIENEEFDEDKHTSFTSYYEITEVSA